MTHPYLLFCDFRDFRVTSFFISHWGTFTYFTQKAQISRKRFLQMTIHGLLCSRTKVVSVWRNTESSLSRFFEIKTNLSSVRIIPVCFSVVSVVSVWLLFLSHTETLLLISHRKHRYHGKCLNNFCGFRDFRVTSITQSPSWYTPRYTSHPRLRHMDLQGGTYPPWRDLPQHHLYI